MHAHAWYLLITKMSWKETCPVCKKEIWVSKGQRVIGCGDCRKAIREHNRKVKRYENKKAKINKTRG